MFAIIWSSESDGKGRGFTVYPYVPDWLPGGDKPYIEVAEWPPSDKPEDRPGYTWEAYVDLNTMEIAWEKVARPLTQREFRTLFTFEERVACNVPPDDPVIKATLKTLMDDLASAQVVELDDPELLMGVQWLEDNGFIGEGRAAEIIAGEPPPGSP